MNKTKIDVAKKTLKLLESKEWEKIKIEDLSKGNKSLSIKKNDYLINLNKYFDYLLRENTSSLETSSSKDMLFEVIMARLDILNLNRKSILKLFNYIKFQPQLFLFLLPSLVESIILILTLAEVEVKGVKGAIKVKVTLVLYILLIFTWSNDNTPSLEKTMTILDKYLNQIDKLAKFV